MKKNIKFLSSSVILAGLFFTSLVFTGSSFAQSADRKVSSQFSYEHQRNAVDGLLLWETLFCREVFSQASVQENATQAKIADSYTNLLLKTIIFIKAKTQEFALTKAQLTEMENDTTKNVKQVNDDGEFDFRLELCKAHYTDFDTYRDEQYVLFGAKKP